MMLSRSASTRSHGRPPYMSCRTRYEGSTSSATRVMTPNAPSPAASPASSGSCRPTRRSSPPAPTYSRPAMAADRTWLPAPEPWVAVAVAPAMETCGSDAKLRSAQPRACSHAASTP
jgi:hypothetical protein